VPIFFGKAEKNETLYVHGDGKQTRDYLYIDDLVNGYRLIAETPELSGQVVNMGTGTETELGWLAETISSLVGKGNIKYGRSRPGEVDSFIADNSKIAEYGFEPKVNMGYGLKLYNEWRQQR
jgi:nucleoside-diphosphate-sugar epimerase